MMEIIEECSECGIDESYLQWYKIEWEIKEGPHRGDTGIGNVIKCEGCGHVHGLDLPMPSFQHEETNTMSDRDTDDDRESPFIELFRDLDRTVQTIADEIHDGIERAEAERQPSPFERIVEQMTRTARETGEGVRIDVEEELNRIREAQGKEPTDDTEERGLYDKYEVRKDGEPVEECFVLEPESDRSARAAIRTYAEITSNRRLASDLHDWMDELHSSGGFEWGDDDG